MSDKSPFTALAGWLRGLGRGTQVSRTGRYCPAGHPMDPNWTSCPRCEAEQRAREKTVREVAPAPPSSTQPASDTMKRNPTAVSGSEQEPPDTSRVTRAFQPEPPPAAPTTASAPAPTRSSQQAAGRRITGVLVTFSARPYGQLFAVYEGRNIIGSGTIASEDDRDCDIQVRDDRELSREHALILCLRGRFQLIDLNSTNGTYLNDGDEPIVRAELPDGARIRTGATIWTFRTLPAGGPPPATPATPAAPDTPTTPDAGVSDPG